MTFTQMRADRDAKPLTVQKLRDRGFQAAADAKERREMEDYYLGDQRWIKS